MQCQGMYIHGSCVAASSEMFKIVLDVCDVVHCKVQCSNLKRLNAVADGQRCLMSSLMYVMPVPARRESVVCRCLTSFLQYMKRCALAYCDLNRMESLARYAKHEQSIEPWRSSTTGGDGRVASVMNRRDRSNQL